MTSVVSVDLVLANIAHSLNVLGSIFITINLVILQFIKKKEIRWSLHYHHLFMVSVSYLALSIGGLILSNTPHPFLSFLCRFQGIWVNYWNLSSMFWSSFLCLNIYMSIATTFYEKLTPKKYIFSLVLSHLISWGFPMLTVMILSGYHAKIFKDLGTGFCWIHSDFYGLRFFLFYLWIGCCWLFNLVMFILVTYKILKFRFSKIKLFTSISVRVALYGLVFVLCWIIGFIVRTVEVFDRSFHAGFFNSIHLFLINSTCFYLALIFIYCENILKEYTICCHFKPDRHLNVVQVSSYNFFAVQYDEDDWEEKMMLFPRKLSKI
eukprot:gene6172-10179_t